MTKGIILLDDCLSVLPTIPDQSYDAIITDPPYDIEPLRAMSLLGQFARIAKGNIIAFCKPENVYWTADEYLFWIKTPSTKNYIRACGRFVEMILVNRRGNTFNRLHWSQMTGVYDDRHISPTEHPYEKPLSLMERLVRIYTNPGDSVLDPFMGSGRTGEACQNLGRAFTGIEIDKKYFDIAARRLHGAGGKDEA